MQPGPQAVSAPHDSRARSWVFEALLLSGDQTTDLTGTLSATSAYGVIKHERQRINTWFRSMHIIL
jgi:hypothetical protein